MSDMRITNMPDGGSPQRVAYDLFYVLRQFLPEGGDKPMKMQKSLDLYAECLKAAFGQKHDTSKIT